MTKLIGKIYMGEQTGKAFIELDVPITKQLAEDLLNNAKQLFGEKRKGGKLKSENLKSI